MIIKPIVVQAGNTLVWPRQGVGLQLSTMPLPLLLLFGLLLLQQRVQTQAGHDSHHHSATKRLPPICDQYLGGKMSREQVHTLRDSMQVQQQALGEEKYWEIMLKRDPSLPGNTDPSWKFAYSSNLTREEKQAKFRDASSRNSQLKAKVEHEVKALQDQGVLPPQTTAQRVSACIMGRLNPHLYPEQITVSFIVEYYKRPWVVKQIAARLLPCRGIVPSEVVVNVDGRSGNDTAEWAQLVDDTQGFVVPVISDNLHELRAYNRMADLAKGKYMILLQVGKGGGKRAGGQAGR